MMQLRQESRMRKRLSIFLVMALLLTFLVSVAPVSSQKNCNDKCIGKERVVDYSIPSDPIETRSKRVESVRIRGVRYTLYEDQTKMCDYGHYLEYCTERTYCANNRKCEETGDPQPVEYGSWSRCHWVTTGYHWDPPLPP